MRRGVGQFKFVRWRGKPGSHDQEKSADVAVPVGLSQRRQHQILRLPRDYRFSGKRRDRSGSFAIGHPGTGRAVRDDAQPVGIRQDELGARARPEQDVAEAPRAGAQLETRGGAESRRLPLLHGGRHQAASGKREHFRGDRRRRAAEAGGELPERGRVQVRGARAAADRGGRAAQAEPAGAAVVGRGRGGVGQADRVLGVRGELC